MITKTIIMKVGGGIMEIPRYKGSETIVQKDLNAEVLSKRSSRANRNDKEHSKRPPEV
ncbi:MAG: hypothetical protein OEM02_17465 [Desulfobulbaceae bacterium]|nr:hypothetical protein [Desulfobulbaceae bacterium]